MTERASIRSATIEDYSAIAEMITAHRPDYPRTEQDLHYADEHRPDYCQHQYFIAEQNDQIVGYAVYTQHADLYQPHEFHVMVYVKADCRRKGVGWALYSAMYKQVTPYSPRTLYARVTEDNIDGFIFASKRGYMENSRRIESRLETTNADLNSLAERIKALSEQGIEIMSFGSLVNADEKLYAIHTAVDAEVPMDTPVTPLPYEKWRANVIDHPQFLAEGTFVAIHDDKFVGISSLFQFVDDMAYVELTGTLPEYRRRGISTALKLSGIAYARSENIPRMAVTNDAVNTGILAINQKLGFIAEPAIISLKLRIES